MMPRGEQTALRQTPKMRLQVYIHAHVANVEMCVLRLQTESASFVCCLLLFNVTIMVPVCKTLF